MENDDKEATKDMMENEDRETTEGHQDKSKCKRKVAEKGKGKQTTDKGIRKGKDDVDKGNGEEAAEGHHEH